MMKCKSIQFGVHQSLDEEVYFCSVLSHMERLEVRQSSGMDKNNIMIHNGS